MSRTNFFALIALLAAAPVSGQEHGLATDAGMPDGWLMRLDRAGASADMADFQAMEPGWHVKTGRAGAAIFWRPEQTAAGEFRASTSLHLMAPAAHPEAFGLFIGGTDLRAEDQGYLYFLVRQNGQYLIKRRNGGETESIVGWTTHDAVPIASGEESTRYDLAIDVGAQTVDFIVNGATVHSLPADQLQTDGIVGVRINHMLDVHVQSLEVDQE